MVPWVRTLALNNVDLVASVWYPSKKPTWLDIPVTPAKIPSQKGKLLFL